jgi:HEAT repeat protein
VRFDPLTIDTRLVDLVGCLAGDDVDLRIEAALILGELRDRRAVPALMTALDDTDVNVRFHAIEALGALDATEAVEALTQIAERRDFFLAFPAIQALTRICDMSVVPRLVPLLGDGLLRVAVAEALGELGDEVAAMPLVSMLNRRDAPTEAVADALAGLHDRYEARYAAGEHIASLVRRGIGAVGTQNLLDAVQRVGPERLRGLARVLGWLDGPAVHRALTRLLGQRAVRAQVVEALVRYGGGVVDLLIEQLQAEDLETRQAAAVALGRIGDRKATAALVEALDDPELALPAAGALARIGDAGAFEGLVELLGHGDTSVRQAAIGALNSIGHPELPARVAALLDHESPAVRESAVRIAGYFGYHECVDRVLERSADPSEAVRRAVVEHLPYFEHAGIVQVLVRALEADTAVVRAAAATAIGRVEGVDALPPLLRALDDVDPWVRYSVLRSMGTLRNPPVASAVLDRLEHDPAGQVRLAALEVLGRLDPPDAVAVLEPLTASQDPDIVRAAIRALGHVDHPDVMPILDAALRADDTWRRLEAVGAIAARGTPEAAATLLWAAAVDGEIDVANAAIAALAVLASRDGTAATAATEALVSLTAEPSRRETSIAALAGLPIRRVEEVAAGLRHLSPGVRRATVEALGRMKRLDASQWMESALDDPEAAVRATAVAELRRLGSRRAARKLLSLARTDPDVEVRRAAVMAVTQQPAGVPGMPSPEAR